MSLRDHVSSLVLPRQRVIDRRRAVTPFLIPDPDFRVERGRRPFTIVYGVLPQDPQSYALSPRMPRGVAS